MEHGGPHIGEFPKLPVCHLPDRPWIRDDARVGHQKTGDIRPVLVYIGPDRPGHDRAGDVGSAPRKGPDIPIAVSAVESGDHERPVILESFAQSLVRSSVEPSVRGEQDAVRRIHKCRSQKGSDDPSAQVLPSGRGEVLARAALDLFPHLLQQAPHVKVHGQRSRDLHVPVSYDAVRLREVQTLLRQSRAGVKQIRDLDVVLIPLSRRGDHDVSSSRIRTDDGFDPANLVGVRDRGAAEFAYDWTHGSPFLPPRPVGSRE